MQEWTVEHLRASPNYWWTFNAAFDYPTAEKLPRVEQPSLVLAPHDDLYTEVQRAIELLPAQAKTLDMPHITNVSTVLTNHAQEIAQLATEFFAEQGAVKS
jgi:hypothetical protein